MFKIFTSKFYKCNHPECTYETWFRSRALTHAEMHEAEQPVSDRLPSVEQLEESRGLRITDEFSAASPVYRTFEKDVQEGKIHPTPPPPPVVPHTDEEHEVMLRRKRLEDEEEAERQRRRRREEEEEERRSNPIVDMATGYAVGEIVESILDNSSSTDTTDYTPGGGEFGGGGASGSWDSPSSDSNSSYDSSSSYDTSSSSSGSDF